MRVREAQALLKAGEYSGAYYLAGYSIECALKACIAKKSKRYDFPDKKTVTDSYTHDLTRLAILTGLAKELETGIDPYLKKNWDVVRGWSEESRYRMNDKSSAAQLINAIMQRGHGVLPCIKHHW